MVTDGLLIDVRWVELDPFNLSGETSSPQNKDSLGLLWPSNSRHRPYGPEGKVGVSTSVQTKGSFQNVKYKRFAGSTDNEDINSHILEAAIYLENNKESSRTVFPFF